jgi:glucose-6-phosphate 1-dehydrogenase
MKKPDNSIIMIFGASGDLTKRKLIPALFQLYRQGLFCNDFAVLGISRTKYDDKSFRESMSNSINEYSENKKIKKKLLNNFVQNIFYTPINTEDADEYSLLKSRIEEISRGKKY